MRQSFLTTIILVTILSVAYLLLRGRNEKKLSLDDALKSATVRSSRPPPQERRFTAPKVVILPGPHKTGTTAIQTCLVDWTKQNSDLMGAWKWAEPTNIAMEAANLRPLMPQKQFAPLLAVLRHENIFILDGKQQPMTNKEQALAVYRKRFQMAWDNKRKIVYGAEAMDFIVSPKCNGTEIMDGVLSILPEPLDKSEIEVSVTYRTPRWKHLISVWHEQGVQDTPLSTFLLGPQSRFIFQSNSLGLALRFQERGLPTTIVDMSGVNAWGIGMCQVIACDVLQVECNKDYQPSSLLDHATPSRSNQKNGKAEMDLSQEQLDDIDIIMTAYDCGIRKSVLQYEPRILFQKDLFSSCPEDAPEQSFSWMVQAIQNVVNNES